MGAGVSCCGGKATDIVESTNPPIEKRSIGVGDSKKTADTGTGNDEEESSQDSGRVSPTPSTVTLDSVYTLEEGDRYTKTPEPNRPGDVTNNTNNTSDYDSSASNGASTKPGRRRKKVVSTTSGSRSPGKNKHLSGSGGQRDMHTISGGSNTDNFARGLRQYPSQPQTNSNQNRPATNFQPSSTQRNRDYLNPGYIGAIGGGYNHTNRTTGPDHVRPGNRVHTIDSANNNQDINKSQDRKNWGPGYRLGGSDVTTSSNRRRNSPDSYVPSAVSSAGPSRSFEQRPDVQYRLESDSSRNSPTSSGFTGRPPLSSRGSLGRQSVEGHLDNGNLSVEGHAMNVRGRRNDNRMGERNSNSAPQKSEAFFLPMDALVATRNSERNNKHSHKKKRKQKGDAFMITFDGDNTSTLPLNGDEENESSSEDEVQISNQSSRNHSGFGDYSYNLSRSNSRSTTVSDIHDNSQSPFDSTQRAFNEYKNNRNSNKNSKNNSHDRIKNKPSAAITGSSRVLPKSDKPSTSYSNHGRSNNTQGTVRAWRNGKEKVGMHRRNNPKTEIDALNEHINDLRQLLSLHMQHQQPATNTTSMFKPTSSTTETSQQQPTTSNDYDSDLIEKLQSEIVALENKLCEKEDRIAELLSGQHNGNESDVMHSDAGVQAEQHVNDVGTEVQEEIKDLEENYEMMLSDLDKNAVTRLNHAKNAALSEEDLNNILKEHVKNRDLLRNNMLQEKQKLNERLQEKLENRKRVDLDAEVESHNVGINDSSTEHQNNERDTVSQKPVVPPYPLQDASNEYGVSNPWKPGLSSIGEDEERRAGKSQRVRSNTFTKDDDDTDGEGVESQNSENTNVAENERNGTFTKEGQSSDNFDDKITRSTNSNDVSQPSTSQHEFETQTDIGGDLNTSLWLQKNEKADIKNSTTESGTSVNIGTSDAETCTEPTLFELQRLTTDIRNTIESIPEKLKENDDQFLEEVRKNGDKMSAEEMHELLKQHVENQEKFEALKVSEIQRQHKALQEKLNQRRKARNEKDEETYDSDDDDLEELVESMGESVSNLKQKRDQQTQFSLHQLPTSEDEIAQLLSKHRHQSQELRQMLLNGKLKHIENLQQKMLLRKQGRIQSNSSEQAVGTQAEQEFQQKGTQAMLQSKDGISIETNTDPIPTRRKLLRDSEKDTIDISGVLKEHKDRVQELRQIKQDYGRVHQEKAQERLAKRLKKKNGDESTYGASVEE